MTTDHHAFFIGGAWHPVKTDQKFDVISPSTEELIGSVPAGSKADVDAAVAAARDAFDNGPWPRMTPAERAGYLTKIAEGIQKRRAEFASLITDEFGTPLWFSDMFHTLAPIMSFNYYAEVGRSLQTEEVRISDLSHLTGDAGGGTTPMAGASLVVKEPAGVAVAFPSFNITLSAIGLKVAPALLAGCTVIIKAAEPDPLAIFAFAEVLEEVGLPPGVVNVVAVRAEESAYLVSHPGVDIVSFTGSPEVGAKIAAACGSLMRPCVLELGGRSAAIVLEDAKLEDIVPTLVMASVAGNNGQNCTAQSRILVPAHQYDDYAEALADAFRSTKVGDPREDGTMIGPLATAAQRARVERYVELGRQEGATIKVGGRRPPHLDKGWYYEPTLMTDVNNDLRSVREEIFGPVAALLPHNGEEDAIRIANDSDLGLHGSVFTADDAHGFEVARQVRTGNFSVNTFVIDLGSPFGGYKQSGLGREIGPTAVDEYQLTKTISIDPSKQLPASVTDGVPRGTGPGAVV